MKITYKKTSAAHYRATNGNRWNCRYKNLIASGKTKQQAWFNMLSFVNRIY